MRVNFCKTSLVSLGVILGSMHSSAFPGDNDEEVAAAAAAPTAPRAVPHAAAAAAARGPGSGKGVVRILSIDGGGLRGAIPGQFLVRLEESLGRGLKIAECFDLIAGTSTGGNLGIGMVLRDPKTERPKYSARDLVGLYTQHGQEIFPNKQRKKVLAGFFKVKYDPAPLERLLEEQLQGSTLRDVATPVFITAYDAQLGALHVFDSEKAKHDQSRNFYLRDVARATSAAPTYFPNAQIRDMVGDLHVFLDGGVVANNPAMHAFLRARELYPEATTFEIISLGTGRCERVQVEHYLSGRSQLDWARYMPSLMMDGASDAVHFLLKQMQEQAGTGYKLNYERIQASLAPQETEMDVAEEGLMARYVALGSALYESHERYLRDFFQELFEDPERAVRSCFYQRGKTFKFAGKDEFDATDLDLKETGLRVICDYLQDHRTEGLKRLYLGQNNISEIPRGTFEGFDHVQTLRLDINRLESVGAVLLRGLTSLTKLRLESNKIKRLDLEAFQHTRNLKQLYLGDNKLTELPVGLFDRLEHLEELRLEHNQLERLTRGIFTGAKNLTLISLTDNALYSLDADTFEGLSQLTRLCLGENYLSGLTQEAFQAWTQLQGQDLMVAPQKSADRLLRGSLNISKVPHQFTL